MVLKEVKDLTNIGFVMFSAMCSLNGSNSSTAIMNSDIVSIALNLHS